ncbi:hypothetical protein [Paenibacillus sp. GCM10012306]|uniref:hypothetical protein n=1 Tax=Paenibacillus sp. GCM10012306 TaxID=3317342 RepID=UPI00361B9DF6
MKIKLVLLSIFLLILLTGCTHNSAKQSNVTNSKDTHTESSESWPFDKLIRFNKHVYMGSDDKIAITEVQELLGVIENSSDDETIASKENFSNYYPVGTKLYTIQGSSSQEAIAIEIDKDTYVLAKINKDH